MENEIKYFSGNIVECNDASTIISEATDLVMASIARDYSQTGLVGKFSMSPSEYNNKNNKLKQAVLAYSAQKSNFSDISETRGLQYAFNSDAFQSIFNAIIAETLLGIVTKLNPAAIMAMANIDEVDVGASKTYEIETKGIPVAQRQSYNNNVTLVDGYSKTGITVTPEVWTLGSSIDFIRVLANNFDFGKEIARVAMGLIYAQYKLVVGLVFDTASLVGTPLYEATFNAQKYTLMISYLQALNNASVKAYGTLPAFQAMGAVATTNYGFETQDELIRNAMLGRAYGVDNIVVEQATDLSAPFITANLSSLLLVPNNKVLLLPEVGDKPVKLVRENFIRVRSKEPKSGSIYRMEYSYTMSFNAGYITQSHYAIQGV